MLNTMGIDLARASFDEIGDEHVGSSLQTPLRDDAFEMDDDLKVELIEKHFKDIMHILGLDLSDDSLKGTPHRVAKMYVKEVFAGLNPKNKPLPKLFENKYKYKEMLVKRTSPSIPIASTTLYPFTGKRMWPTSPMEM